MVTKLKAGATLIVVVIVGAIYYATFGDGSRIPRIGNAGSCGPGEGSDDNFVLSAKWDPPALSNHRPVQITISVDGHPWVKRSRHLSPYGETMTCAKGAYVKLVAETKNPDVTLLDCMIMRNGRSIPRGGYHSIDGPGAVECTA